MPPGNLNVVSRMTRNQGPEFEQTLAWAALTQVSTPTALRTDRKITWIDLHMRGRLTNSAAPGTYRTNTLLGTAMFSLIQQVTVRGQHLRYGAQQPIVMRGEFCAELCALMNPNYIPRFSNANNGAAAIPYADLVNTASHTNDFEFTLPIPTFPLGITAFDVPMYCIHGPDWPGNLYLDVLCADVTALAVTTSQTPNPTAYASATGSPSIDILTERPLLGKALASQVRPAVTFRIQNFSQPTAAVSTGAGGTGVKIADLTVGKDTSRIFLKVGTALTGVSAGVAAYVQPLLDGVITRTFFSLDNRQLRFQNANGNPVLQDYMGRSYGRSIIAGYQMLDFLAGQAQGAMNSNPRAVFQSSQLTAARQFQLNGDVTEASTYAAELVQEMILGAPQLLKPPSCAGSCTPAATCAS
jgi:hypothetical protein